MKLLLDAYKQIYAGECFLPQTRTSTVPPRSARAGQMGKKDEASKKSISNLNGNVMSPWWQ